MAKKSSIETNARRRRLVEQYKEKRRALKAVVMDKSKEPEERFEATLELSKLPRNSARIRVRNRCTVSGRPRAYYRKFGLSRIALRELASLGLVPGVVKSSW